MRILFLTQILPYPLDSGAKVRAYHVLQYLSARHEVTLVSFSRDSDTPAAIDHLRSLCHAVHLVPLKRSRLNEILNLIKSFITAQPFTILRDQRRDMQQLVIDLLRDTAFDAIHADQLAMAQYALLAKPDRFPSARSKLVIDAHNAYYLIPRRMASVSRNFFLKKFLQLEAQRVAHYEAQTYRRFDHVLTVTNDDLASIKQLADFAPDQPRFTNLPICIDASTPPIVRQSNPRGLLMLGGLHWPPNADAARWFAQEIFPLIKSKVPDVKLSIVGARPPQDIQALAQSDSITISGYVDDLQPFIESNAALIVALRSGGGMRVKIIEALQWGLPIVSTSIGCEGIDLIDSENILIADEPQKFADAVIKLLNDQLLGAHLAENGRRLIQEHYDWRKVYQALESIYSESKAS